MKTYNQLTVYQQRQATDQVAEIPGFTRFDAIKKFQYTIDKNGNIERCLYMGLEEFTM